MVSSTVQYLHPANWSGARNAWQVRQDLWRMGRFEWVDADGWQQMVEDGVTTVVDVRTPPEVKRRERDPVVEMPGEIRRIHWPVEDIDHESFWERNSPYPMHPDAYQDTMDTFGDRVATAISTVLDAWQDGGTVLHCTAGRDRTGLVLGLVLQLPDIPGGAADWEEQQRVYASGAHGINEHHRTSPVPHPYESYLKPDAFHRELADRLASYRKFLRQWPGERVLELLARNSAQ
ncbi:tyrosine-protein phosphatase [Yaniella halotolerans]|uniref:tyrosine-protein phosphatase n=1 Tax=Yaniella halotolerans TaxID=225453 RepID=UPI0003B63BD9|nr:tyrosine-protein phosphatase [Yaniella halotolerans]